MNKKFYILPLVLFGEWTVQGMGTFLSMLVISYWFIWIAWNFKEGRLRI